MPGVLELKVAYEVTLVALLDNVTVEGLKLIVNPDAGNVVLWDSATSPLKPFTPETVAVKVAVELAGKLTVVLLRVTPKSVTLTEMVTVPMSESVRPEPAASFVT